MDNSAKFPQAGMYVMGGCLIVSIQLELYDDVISEIQQGILDKVHQTRIRGVILDVSMVELMDAHIAESLAKTVQMADMLGARTVVVGIRPAVASALMDLESPPLGMCTAVTLEQALSLLEPIVRPKMPEPEGANSIEGGADSIDGSVDSISVDSIDEEAALSMLEGDAESAVNSSFAPDGNSVHG
ncbi:STAS domain-containing protein [Marinobacter fonticola]|uniref:STAS domain-containing protein n=1 Tax=Marinobacter fonticola TaxID=2603215 RepID=UPI0011E6A4DA|nr:STAS domain-containing protein [Marinobacter fonticola]